MFKLFSVSPTTVGWGQSQYQKLVITLSWVITLVWKRDRRINNHILLHLNFLSCLVLQGAGASPSMHWARGGELHTLDRSAVYHTAKHTHISFYFYWLENLMETTTHTVLYFLQFKSKGHMNKPPVCPTIWGFIRGGFRLRESWSWGTVNKPRVRYK